MELFWGEKMTPPRKQRVYSTLVLTFRYWQWYRTNFSQPFCTYKWRRGKCRASWPCTYVRLRSCALSWRAPRLTNHIFGPDLASVHRPETRIWMLRLAPSLSHDMFNINTENNSYILSVPRYRLPPYFSNKLNKKLTYLVKQKHRRYHKLHSPV